MRPMIALVVLALSVVPVSLSKVLLRAARRLQLAAARIAAIERPPEPPRVLAAREWIELSTVEWGGLVGLATAQRPCRATPLCQDPSCELSRQVLKLESERAKLESERAK